MREERARHLRFLSLPFAPRFFFSSSHPPFLTYLSSYLRYYELVLVVSYLSCRLSSFLPFPSSRPLVRLSSFFVGPEVSPAAVPRHPLSRAFPPCSLLRDAFLVPCLLIRSRL